MKPDISGVTPPDRELIRILRPGSWKKAELRLVETSAGPCVEKDYRGLSPLLRFYAAVILRREKQAYKALKAVGVYFLDCPLVSVAKWFRGIPLEIHGLYPFPNCRYRLDRWPLMLPIPIVLYRDTS